MTRSEATRAAYGGPGWSARTDSHADEIGRLWAACGVDCEFSRLEAVLLHRPGSELNVSDVDAALMLDRPDVERAGAEHDAVAAAYRDHGVEVHYVDPVRATPNLMYVADLFFMTPEGAILARPASTVRAGEEREVARRLADLGIPIVRTLSGDATFEGADAAWLDAQTVMIGQGFRTNGRGAGQVRAALRERGIEVHITGVSEGAMHLMGQLRFIDHDLAMVRPGRLQRDALEQLREHGFTCVEFPDEHEMDVGFAHNFVTLSPRAVLLPEGCPVTQNLLASHDVRCTTVGVHEILKGAGGIGCLTGVLRRERA